MRSVPDLTRKPS